ncbi:MAG: undecaprenyl-diphosphate phosphatase [Minisyncoccia bacterium]
MNIFQIIILGIVEGITEFLPISSTGHLILCSEILKLPQNGFLKSFEIIIQSGAIFAVLLLFWRKFLNLEILKRIFIALLPTAIFGIAFYKIFKNVLMKDSVVLFSLFFVGLIFIIFELFKKDEKNNINGILEISYKKSFLIGLFQVISMVPGVSRSGATILGGMLLGIKRKTIVEFSFLLAIPTMLGVSFLEGINSFFNFSLNEFLFLILGFLVSFLSAFLAVKFFLNFIKKHNFIVFGIYRIIFSVLFWFFKIVR